MKLVKLSGACMAFLMSVVSLQGWAAENDNKAEENSSSNTNTALDTDTEKNQDLERRLRLLLRNNESLSTRASSIQIKAEDGVVTLSGSAASLGEKNKIEGMVRQVNGVKKVTNDLEISRN